ncbi:hypothetical protein E2562_026676 [Oryza meyeriana var. granulata]|uniref:Uncharacterized protein n=1 Tax=Oryza meyeriana var. granulata TaxID=110450 RepID=A0A6G1C0M4_9ORYZ|nr:hypothetical protein E2562_026676 [Oryza meyeriana var. granulata]
MSCHASGDPRLHRQVFVRMPQLYPDLRRRHLVRASSPPLARTPSVGLAELPPPASSLGTSHCRHLVGQLSPWEHAAVLTTRVDAAGRQAPLLPVRRGCCCCWRSRRPSSQPPQVAMGLPGKEADRR